MRTWRTSRTCFLSSTSTGWSTRASGAPRPVSPAASTYSSQLRQLSGQSLGAIFTLVSYAETEIVSGITAWCQTTHQYTIGLGTSNNGQTLVFSDAAPATIVHGITQ